MIALLPTGGKLCHQPQVMSLYPLALLQGYTQKSVLFCCCLFLQGLPYGKQDVFLYFEKIAAIALILLASPTLLFPLWMIHRGYLWICTRCLQHHCSPFVYKGYLCSPLDEELLFNH